MGQDQSLSEVVGLIASESLLDLCKAWGMSAADRAPGLRHAPSVNPEIHFDENK